jgi:hypothetical protein
VPAEDARAQWIARVLGVAIGGAAAGSEEQQAYADLLATVTADLRALAARDAAAAAPIAALVARAEAEAKAVRWQPGIAALLQATDALATASGAAQAAAAKAAIPEGTVARIRDLLSQSASRWDRALAAARAGAGSFASELRARYPDEAAGFQAILDSYWSDLSQAIAATAKGGQPDPAAVLQTAQTLRAEMDGDRLFAYLDRSGVPVRAAFVSALDEVESLLADA